jgi:hypothetical protein
MLLFLFNDGTVVNNTIYPYLYPSIICSASDSKIYIRQSSIGYLSVYEADMFTNFGNC